MECVKQKKRILWIFVLVLVFAFTVLAVLRNLLFCPFFYANNSDLDVNTNEAIKGLLLNSVKEKSLENKCLFGFIATDFMKTAEQTGEDRYTVRIQTYFMDALLEDAVYEYQVERTDEGFVIASFGVDP